MGSEDSANLVRRGYAAFSTGDMAMLSELFATTQSGMYREAAACPARSTGEMPSWRSSVS
jgi:ketosteroid isomerase-like protein